MKKKIEKANKTEYKMNAQEAALPSIESKAHSNVPSNQFYL